MLSIVDGHKVVLAALSDFRVAFDEDFRFKNLLSNLRTVDIDIDDDENSVVGFGDEEDGVWEARIGVMALLNALTNCPEDLEERILLREELSRRGLNELIVVRNCVRSQIHSLMGFIQALRYIKPPDSLLTQLNLYTEEKFEDEEDMRERARSITHQMMHGHQRSRSDSEAVLQDLIQLAKQHGELYPTMLDILKHYGQILQRDVGL